MIYLHLTNVSTGPLVVPLKNKEQVILLRTDDAVLLHLDWTEAVYMAWRNDPVVMTLLCENPPGRLTAIGEISLVAYYARGDTDPRIIQDAFVVSTRPCAASAAQS